MTPKNAMKFSVYGQKIVNTWGTKKHIAQSKSIYI